jgi:hypothetical protein
MSIAGTVSGRSEPISGAGRRGGRPERAASSASAAPRVRGGRPSARAYQRKPTRQRMAPARRARAAARPWRCTVIRRATRVGAAAAATRRRSARGGGKRSATRASRITSSQSDQEKV